MPTKTLLATTRISAAGLLVILAAVCAQATDSSLVVLEDRLNDLVYRASRSIVTFESLRSIEPGMGYSTRGEAVHSLISSGIICDTLGHILVAATSVVGRDRLLVHYDNQTVPARLRGIDYHTGLALVAVDRKLGVPVRMSPRHGCAGDMVIAVGNSYGVRASPALGFCAGSRPDGTIQFSAIITSGTVGGGLFDLTGQLVGVITGGIGDSRWAEVGVAIPAQQVKESLGHLRSHGDRPAGYIGITSADIEISPGIEVSQPAKLAHSGTPRVTLVERGVMITEVVPLAPAANAGLLRGDLLTSLNGTAINSAYQLRSIIRFSRPGSLIEVGFIRDRVPYVVPLQIGRLEFTADSFPGGFSNPQAGQEPLVDSLLSEINSLKQALRSLEDRLRGLR